MLVALIMTRAPLHWMAFWVSATLFGFYILGWVLRRLIVSGLPPEEEELMPGMERPLDEEPLEEEIRATKETPRESPQKETATEALDEKEESAPMDDYDDDLGYDDDYLNQPVEDSFLDD